MSKNKTKSIPLRFGVQDSILLVWKKALATPFSTTVKDILYSYYKKGPYKTFLYKKITIDEDVLKPCYSNISFSQIRGSRIKEDLELYNYLNSSEFDPISDNCYMSNDLSNKIKKVLLDNMDPSIKKIIIKKLKEYNSSLFIDNEDIYFNPYSNSENTDNAIKEDGNSKDDMLLEENNNKDDMPLEEDNSKDDMPLEEDNSKDDMPLEEANIEKTRKTIGKAPQIASKGFRNKKFDSKNIIQNLNVKKQ